MTAAYVPDRGDLVWLEFTPQTGSEQAGRRPALVISPRAYNAKVGLALFCPVTSRVKGYPFEVALPEGSGVAGVVLADQLKSLDWRARKAKLIERASADVLAMVTARILPTVSRWTKATVKVNGNDVKTAFLNSVGDGNVILSKAQSSGVHSGDALQVWVNSTLVAQGTVG